MSSDNKKIIWSPQPGPQTLLLQVPETVDEIFFGGAKGGGKSDGILGYMAEHAMKHGKRAKLILFRLSYPELEPMIERSMEMFSGLRGAEYLKGPRTWMMPGGASWKFRQLENEKDAMKYFGHSYTCMGIDELPNYRSKSPIDKVAASLRSAAGVHPVFVASGNPGCLGHEWVKDRYINPAKPMTFFYDEGRRKRCLFIPSRLQDNAILMQNDPNYVNRLHGAGPAWLVRAWLNGDWDATLEGDLIKRDWIKYISELPRGGKRIVQSLDTAQKDDIKKGHAPTVIGTWIESEKGDFLVDVFRDWLTYPDLKKAAKTAAAKWKPNMVLIEDKSSGSSLIQELRIDQSYNYPIKAIEPCGDKYTRMYQQSAWFETGHVFILDNAHWTHDYINEITGFPDTLYADQVDMTSQYLSYVHESGNMSMGEMLRHSHVGGQRESIDFTGKGSGMAGSVRAPDPFTEL